MSENLFRTIRIATLAVSTAALSGCFLEPGEIVMEKPLGSVEFNGGNTLSLTVGFGSGAYHRPGDDERIFYTITDRGPNVACGDAAKIIGIADFCQGDDAGKVFPQPTFTPTIYEIKITNSRSGGNLGYKIIREIPLRDSTGDLISGVTNPLTVTTTENAYGADAALLAFDSEGLDTEALVRLQDGSFWLADEYGPSLVHVGPSGRVIQRVVPATMEADLADADYPVAGLLPEIYKNRKLNRGMESIAVTPDEKFIYFIMQSPLANPDNSAYAGSRNVRVVKMALNTNGSIGGLVGEYVYVMDTAQTFADKAAGRGDLKGGEYRKQSDVKISEMVAIAEDDLIVLERISAVTKLYRINVAHADNILGGEFDSLVTTPSLEQRYDLASSNAKPVTKKLVFNSLTDVADGTLPSKVEGIALLDDTHVALINDNDFGIAGDETKLVILPIAEQLTEGDAPSTIELSKLSTYESGVFDAGAAEIVAFDETTDRLFVVNANAGTVDVLDISAPATPILVNSIHVAADITTPVLGNANSVAVSDGVLAVAVEADNKQANGVVAFYNTQTFAMLKSVVVGALPDMVTFTPDGRKAVVANEGEPNDSYTNDPEGSISIIDLTNGIANASVIEVGFTEFNIVGSRAGELPAGVRVFGPNATVAQDIEPEYVAISEDSKTATVALQENNAFAIIDLESASIKSIQALGFKDFSRAGNELDASDKDGAIHFRNWDNVLGMYNPDGIATYRFQNSGYILSANEGDSRDYSGFGEENRVGDFVSAGLASDSLTLYGAKQDLGRLKITNTLGITDGILETAYAFGARSFSIWDEAGSRVFDSGSDMERITAERYPAAFNTTNDETDVDNRSDDKGPEPENVTVGIIDGQTYAFIGLERVGGIMVYNVSSPFGPQFIQYINNRDFSADPTTSAAGDLAPEGITFIGADKSPNGKPLLAVGNEVSGTTTLYEINVK